MEIIRERVLQSLPCSFLKIKTGLASDVILGAYKRTLRGGGCPIVLAEEETHLAKNVRPSASVWANDRTSRGQSYYEAVITSALRSPDPYQKVVGSWLIRRLSPDSNPISIEEIPEERNEEALLLAMGTETANVHLGSRRRIKAVLKDLRARKKDWLRNDVRNMAKVFLREWKEYRRL